MRALSGRETSSTCVGIHTLQINIAWTHTLLGYRNKPPVQLPPVSAFMVPYQLGLSSQTVKQYLPWACDAAAGEHACVSHTTVSAQLPVRPRS
jgi:hypothetical protein